MFLIKESLLMIEAVVIELDEKIKGVIKCSEKLFTLLYVNAWKISLLGALFYNIKYSIRFLNLFLSRSQPIAPQLYIPNKVYQCSAAKFTSGCAGLQHLGCV